MTKMDDHVFKVPQRPIGLCRSVKRKQELNATKSVKTEETTSKRQRLECNKMYKIFRLVKYPDALIVDPLSENGQSVYLEKFVSCIANNQDKLRYLQFIRMKLEFYVGTKTFPSGMKKLQNGKVAIVAEGLSGIVEEYLQSIGK